MSHDYYSNNFRPNPRGYHANKYKNSTKYNNNIPTGKIREVEIQSITQTEPTKQKKTKESDTIENQIDKAEINSKVGDETTNFASGKQEFNINPSIDECGFKDVNEQLRVIFTKLDEIDIDKKLGEISTEINLNIEGFNKEAIASITKAKSALEKKIEELADKNNSNGNEIKSLFSWQCVNDLRLRLVNLKGDYYAKPGIISSVYDFEKYYDSILSSDGRDKLIYSTSTSKQSFSEIINMIYDSFNTKNNTTAGTQNEKFWFIVNSFANDNKGKTKLKLNGSGTGYRVIKHFRGIPDDIVIEFGDGIPILNCKKKVEKAKKKINIVANIIYEILYRQVQISGMSNKIFAYGHIYFGKKSKEIEIKDFLENDIYYDYVELI